MFTRTIVLLTLLFAVGTDALAHGPGHVPGEPHQASVEREQRRTERIIATLDAKVAKIDKVLQEPDLEKSKRLELEKRKKDLLARRAELMEAK